MAMHLSFGMHLELGFFAYIPCVCAMSLLPPLFWNYAEKVFYAFHQRLLVSRQHRDTRLIVHVDLSHTGSPWTQWWHVLIAFAGFSDRLVTLRTKPTEEIRTMMDQQNTRLIVSFQPVGKQKQFLPADATYGSFCDVLLFSPLFFPLGLLYRLFPRPVKTVCEQIAEVAFHSRSWQEIRSTGSTSLTPHPYHEKNLPYAIALYLSTLGEFLGRVFLQPRKQTASRQWTRVKRFWKGISTVTVIIVFLFCVLWNAQHHVHETHLVVLQVISEVAQLDQWWGMFSPNPPLEYGWFVVCTTL